MGRAQRNPSTPKTRCRPRWVSRRSTHPTRFLWTLRGSGLTCCEARISPDLNGDWMIPTRVNIKVQQWPEGVFLATSDEVPGLTVECDARDEVVATALEIAVELLE